VENPLGTAAEHITNQTFLCNTLQHAATHCNTLQDAAPHCTACSLSRGSMPDGGSDGFSAKEAIIIGLFCAKEPIIIGLFCGK